MRPPPHASTADQTAPGTLEDCSPAEREAIDEAIDGSGRALAVHLAAACAHQGVEGLRRQQVALVRTISEFPTSQAAAIAYLRLDEPELAEKLLGPEPGILFEIPAEELEPLMRRPGFFARLFGRR
jgi:hypothetical protein